MATQRKVVLNIVNGPSKWAMMLAVFDDQPVTFQFGGKEELLLAVYRLLDGRKLHIEGINFPSGNWFGGSSSRNQCNFDMMFPDSQTGGTMVRGKFDLETRKGEIDITELCKDGTLPWPD